MTETVYTQAQMDGNVRALTTTLAELRERTDEVGRLEASVRSMQGSDAILRAQVDMLEQLRDAAHSAVAVIGEQRDAALALVREAVNSEWHDGEYINPHADAAIGDWLDRARALLKDGE